MFEQEMETGCLAVVEAMRITRLIQRDLTGKDSITKSDKSPVTIADYTSQAIICKMLKTRFPGIPIVGEEHSDALKKAEHTEILNKIFHYIENDEKTARWLNRDNLCECIDLGGDEPTDGVFWTLDPVDGTKGFLRGEQFAIALALIVNGEVRLGILGCPNLDIPGHPARFGWLIRSVKGEGSFLENPETGEIIKCHISDITDPRHMRFVESYVSAHSDKDTQLKISQILELEGVPVQLDSQVKYGILASGNAEIYLRIPHPGEPGYKEKIWDHAAGSLIVQEAGGIVTDIYCIPLDFSRGKTLRNNSGILASVPAIHNRICRIIGEMK